MIVKICGIKDLASMEAALEAGADMVGLVFFGPSPRNVSPLEAVSVTARARGKAKVVALTVDADDSTLDLIVKHAAPDLLQLHGKETPARVRELRVRHGLPVLKAIGISSARDLDIAAKYDADWMLFDAKPPKDATRPGGHGVAFDWSLLKNAPRNVPFMLSGGLDPENVSEAIRVARPNGVDVSSGVESAPGVKDRNKVLSFVRAARASVMERAS